MLTKLAKPHHRQKAEMRTWGRKGGCWRLVLRLKSPSIKIPKYKRWQRSNFVKADTHWKWTRKNGVFQTGPTPYNRRALNKQPPKIRPRAFSKNTTSTCESFSVCEKAKCRSRVCSPAWDNVPLWSFLNYYQWPLLGGREMVESSITTLYKLHRTKPFYDFSSSVCTLTYAFSLKCFLFSASVF